MRVKENEVIYNYMRKLWKYQDQFSKEVIKITNEGKDKSRKQMLQNQRLQQQSADIFERLKPKLKVGDL